LNFDKSLLQEERENIGVQTTLFGAIVKILPKTIFRGFQKV
jgi:hypothetical protein